MFSNALKYVKYPVFGLCLAGPIDTVIDQDVIDPKIKTAKSFERFKEVDQETGMDRIKMMFQLDEFDNISPELHSIYNAGFLGLFTGMCYGGFLGSKKAYMDFMERNQATAFQSHLDAKKKLQESVVFNFVKGGWNFGWRMGVFATMYVGISTTISVYRNKFTIFEYIAGGMITGAVYKWKMGPTGMAAGCLVGGGLGLVAGAISVGILSLTGTTMEEMRYWQYKWKSDRVSAYKEGFHKQLEGTDLSFRDKLLDQHDAKVGSKKVDLSALDATEVNQKASS